MRPQVVSSLAFVAVVASTLLLPRLGSAQCPSDCDGDGRVAIQEMIRAVRIALDHDPVSVCPAADTDFDQSVAINELIQAVNASLGGCPEPTAFDGPIAFNVEPTDPLVLEVPLENGQTITLYGALDPAGVPSRLTSAVIRGPTETYTVLFDESDQLEQIHVESMGGQPMGRFDMTWLSTDRLQVDYSDMGTLGIELPLRTSAVVDIEGGAASATGASDPESPSVAPSAVAAVAVPPATLPITVRDCDDRPIGDVARVRLRATWRGPAGQVTETAVLDAEELLPGNFRAMVPVRPVELEPVIEARRQYCHRFADVVIRSCQQADCVLSSAPQICAALHFGVTAAALAAGVAVLPVSIPACVAAVTSARAFCATTQRVPDSLNVGCDLIYLPDDAVATLYERFFGETVDLLPEVIFDNGLVETGPPQTLPAIAPATSFDFMVGTPQILDVRTEPHVPLRGTDYQLVAKLSCIPSGSHVFMSARDPDSGAPPRRLIQSFEGSGELCLGVPSGGPGSPSGGYHESILRVTGASLPGGQELKVQRAIVFQE